MIWVDKVFGDGQVEVGLKDNIGNSSIEMATRALHDIDRLRIHI